MVANVNSRETISKALERVASSGERLVIKHRGKDAAALFSLDDLALLQELEDRADLMAARKAQKEKGVISLDVIKKRLD
jgi:PHD/YefM family antitoxin component YafN of YafNO toxin-antitoxin module